MKNIVKTIISLLVMLPAMSFAQSDFTKGYIVTASNERITGAIKKSFSTTGKIRFVNEAGRKQTYYPDELKGFSCDYTIYHSYRYDFYKMITSGEKAVLYQKVTDNSGKVVFDEYGEAALASTTEGKKGDFYLWLPNREGLHLITSQNFEAFFKELFSGYPDLLEAISNGSIAYPQIIQAVERYNKSAGKSSAPCNGAKIQ